MNRSLIILILFLFGIQMIVFAETNEMEIPRNIRNNRFFVESLRFNNMARIAFADGDYLASIEYSEEAIRFSNLSDEFVLLQLKILETDTAITHARRRLEFADSVNAATRYPEEYRQAQADFTQARIFRQLESWDEAIEAAHRVLAALAHLGGLPGDNILPSQYTVRTWANEKDALWNIAGRPWVYNDPWQWRRLFEANRDRMPERDNPDLIHPGMVLDIPPIRGETRQGMWTPGRDYPALPR